mmetsp:Transcript_2888/g.4382  ORF Transcript_2888/g.4382 Transcript_2888/m.4382 type:complete len:106 (+) Transcript_2888:299-616(+)
MATRRVISQIRHNHNPRGIQQFNSVWSQYNDGFKGIVYGGEICHGKLRRVGVAFVVVIIFLASNNKTMREEGVVPSALSYKWKWEEVESICTGGQCAIMNNCVYI